MNLTISKISPINYRSSCISNPKQKVQKCQNADLMSFLGAVAAQKKIELDIKDQSFYNTFIHAKGKVTKEEYEDIKKNHPNIIKKANEDIGNFYRYTCGGICTPEDVAEIAIKVDKYFKENYKDCRIISLGTSPSPITEQLANMGQEVIFLPVSGFKCCQDIFSNLDNSPEMNALIEYLKSKGVDNEKTNIILDYTVTGSTLATMTNYIKNRLNIANKNIKPLSVVDNLLIPIFNCKYEPSQNHLRLKNEIADRYLQDMFYSTTEYISNVPHFPILESKIIEYKRKGRDQTIYLRNQSNQELFRSFEECSRPFAREFSLCTMAEIDKQQSKSNKQQ